MAGLAEASGDYFAVLAADLQDPPEVAGRFFAALHAGDVDVIVGTREAQTLNGLYRGKDYATNVLAFVYDEQGTVSGDIVLCAPVLRQEAKAQRKPLADHCAHLVVHGMPYWVPL